MTDTAFSRTTPDASFTAGFWGSYALAVLDRVDTGPAIMEYLAQIDATLAPYGGRFLIHGAPWTQVEGDRLGDPVLIGFPDRDGARRWFESAACQAIAPLRAEHSISRVFLCEGVDGEHRSTDVIAQLTGSPG